MRNWDYFMLKTLKLISILVLYLFSNPLLAECDAKQCQFKISLEQAGFYVPAVRLPANGTEGFWGLTLNTSLGYNTGGFNAGGVLGENATYPGFIGFYLTRREAVRISAYEYTGQISELTVSIRNAQNEFVLAPSNFPANGAEQQTDMLEPGFYVAAVYSRNGDPRGRFGISLQGFSFGGGVNVGGWIDSYTGGNGEGFGGVYVASPQDINLTLQFGDSYGSAGASQPEIELYLQENTGVRSLKWSTPKPLTPSQYLAQLQKTIGKWKISANTYPEVIIDLTETDLGALVVRGTKAENAENTAVYVSYDENRNNFYLYAQNEQPEFWFSFIADNSIVGCVIDSKDKEASGDCSLSGVRF
jgi:hypothetical protein